MNLNIKKIREIEGVALSLEEAKTYLRVAEHHDDDNLILSLIDTGISFVENYIKENIKKREYKLELRAKTLKVQLPSPVLEIKEIRASEDEVLEAEADYELHGSVLHIKEAREVPLNIIMIVGYEVLPSAIKHAILVYVSLLYDQEILSPTSLQSVYTLLTPYKKYRII